MRLTRFTDYSLRVLIYLGTKEGHSGTIPEITRAYGVSRNHLLKVVRKLVQHEFLSTRRGKGGGLRLARPPREINVGDVVRRMEETLAIVECLQEDANSSTCLLTPTCRLKGLFREARETFLASLDRYTLEDLLSREVAIRLDLPGGMLARAV